MTATSLRTILVFLILYLLKSPAVKAGDFRKISGEAHYHSPFTEAPSDAEKRAILEARIDALNSAFGVAVSERTMSVNDIYDGHTSTRAQSYNESEVNGEWLRDIKEPEITTERDKYGTIYHVKVYGEAREIKFNKIDVDCRLLCNGTDPDRDRLRGSIFYEGDEMYVYFTSPVSGWLAIYLVDDDEHHTTQCLVPYDGQCEAETAYPIQANKEYVFFSKRTAEPRYVDYVTRMIVEARKRVDINNLYVIFSPNKFSQTASVSYKHSVHGTDERELPAELMPRETTHDKFDRWLHKLRCHDADLQPIPINFSIRKK